MMRMRPAPTTPVLTLLCGAFDRHNLGDLLFPHIAAKLLAEAPLLCAGVAERDMRPYGGHQVHALSRLALEYQEQPVNILHAGGELLACDSWQAAVMVQPQGEAQTVIAALDDKPKERLAWARHQLGGAALAPYVAGRELFPRTRRLLFCGVGGIALDHCDPSLRAEVMVKLASADLVAVRDRVTQAHLQATGITAALVPDPAVMVAELSGNDIQQHSRQGEVAQIRSRFPHGYIAVQFSADFGDDETLGVIAAQLDQVVAATGYGVVLFRAGAAPWHDDLECYLRLAARLPSRQVAIFESLDIWDICALIAKSRGYCGSSLHGRIVALTYGLPRINILHPSTSGVTKQEAFAAAWELPEMSAVVAVERIAVALAAARAVDPTPLRQLAATLASHYRHWFNAAVARL